MVAHMINNQITIDGQSTTFTFTTKDTEANVVMVEVFNAISELAQAGVTEVKITIERIKV